MKISPAPAADTYAERAVREARERAEKRRLELAEQRSADKPPGIRIRVWEKVHALRLPRDPEHPILYVIATGTGLTLAQVREEQRTRFPEQAALAPAGAPGSEYQAPMTGTTEERLLHQAGDSLQD